MNNPNTPIKYNLNPFNLEIEEGISLFTAIKNRKDTFIDALETWVVHEEIDEIIIVDWSSDESLIPIIQKYQNGKIFLAVVEDQAKWILSQACNLAARLTTKSKLLKMDADVKIHKGFFEKHQLNPGFFYAGNWSLARDENQKHLNGVAFFYRDDFFRVNGYNEFIKSYGWDDDDLYLRLEQLILKRVDFKLDSLYHIEHGNRTLLQDNPMYFRNIAGTEREKLNIIINRPLGYTSMPWSPFNTMLDFSIKAVDKHFMAIKQVGEDTNIIPIDIRQRNELIAVAERLQTLDPEFPKTLINQLSREELIEFYNLFFIPEPNSPEHHLFTFIQKVKQHYQTTNKQFDAEITLLSADKILLEQSIQTLKKDIQEKELLVVSKDQTISGQAHLLGIRDQTINEKDQFLRSRDQMIAQRDQTIHERDQLLGIRDQTISEKDQLLRSMDLMIDNRDQEISAAMKIVEAKDQIILKQTETIGNYEISSIAQQRAIEKNSETILQQARELQEKAFAILERNSIIYERDAMLTTIQQNIHKQLEKISDLEMKLSQEQQAIEDMRKSFSWKSGHFVFSLIGKVLPWMNKHGK